MSVDKPRKQAFLLLDDIVQNKKYANLTLKSSLNGFDERDKAFICALVYGTLDKLISIDYVISLYAKGKIQPKVKNILRLGAYQILYLDRVPDSAAVNTSVSVAESIGKGMLKGYINGVLRAISNNKSNIPYPKNYADMLSVKYSYPLFIVLELIKQLGKEETEKFLAYDGSHKTNLRVDTSKADFNEIKAKLNGEDSVYFDDCFTVEGAPTLLEKGICSVQGEASMAVVRALDVKENERILDACAAPGGKTVYIASLMQRGAVYALDKYPHRVNLIEKNAIRCGYESIIFAKQHDMCERMFEGEFDKVLVDAPCSGLGVLGQKPEIKNTLSEAAVKELEATQKAILENASKSVKQGGILVYSTCTVRENENINTVLDFLKAHGDFELTSMEKLFGEKFEKGRDLSKGYIQLYPYKDNTDGFFIARMKRI